METAGDSGNGGETPEEAVEEEVVLYPEGTLDPDLVNAETPVQARALKEAYFAWGSMEVTVAGYPYISYGDSNILEEEITLKASPESEEELVTVETCPCAYDGVTPIPPGQLAEPIPEETESLMVANRDGVRIRGTVAGESFGKAALESCVIVSP